MLLTEEEDAVSNPTISLTGWHHAVMKKLMHGSVCMPGSKVKVIKVIKVKANDTDAVVIAISLLQALQQLGVQQLWVAFGQRQNLEWVPVHDLCCILAEKNKETFFFHTFTGCSVVSAFHGKGRKSAW